MNGGWMHVTANYIGPDTGEGIRAYQNGLLTIVDEIKTSKSYSPGSGHVTIGGVKGSGDYYVSLEIDELAFFNRKLSDDEIDELYQMYS